MNLPHYNIRTRASVNQAYQEVWDTQRQKWVKLTPEEWVRQHFVNYLVNYRGFPAGRVGNEVAIRVGQMEKRCDTVVFGNEGEPRMIVEYKAESVELTQKVFSQISRYNLALQVDWLVISNGQSHYCFHLNREKMQWEARQQIPTYQEIL